MNLPICALLSQLLGINFQVFELKVLIAVVKYPNCLPFEGVDELNFERKEGGNLCGF
jgi:hypothetical protein